MTREDIIRMAREAEDYVDTIYQKGEYHPGWLEVFNVRFAALVAEAEREACAKIADSQIENTAILLVNPGKSAAAWDIANAIRARGEK
jgi:ethanolamine utilization microcompartment shell protein EutS